MEWFIFGVFAASLYFYFNRKKGNSDEETKEIGKNIEDTSEK